MFTNRIEETKKESKILHRYGVTDCVSIESNDLLIVRSVLECSAFDSRFEV